MFAYRCFSKHDQFTGAGVSALLRFPLTKSIRRGFQTSPWQRLHPSQTRVSFLNACRTSPWERASQHRAGDSNWGTTWNQARWHTAWCSLGGAPTTSKHKQDRHWSSANHCQLLPLAVAFEEIGVCLLDLRSSSDSDSGFLSPVTEFVLLLSCLVFDFVARFHAGANRFP